MSDEDDYCYAIKVPFPDDDSWVYVLTDSGLNEGKLFTFKSENEANKWLADNNISNAILEKIKRQSL